MCLQRPQKIRPLCDELLFSEFICRDPDFMIKLTIDKRDKGTFLNIIRLIIFILIKLMKLCQI